MDIYFIYKKRTQPATQAGSLTGRISWNLSLSVPGFVYQFAKATDLNIFGNLFCVPCYCTYLLFCKTGKR